VELHGVNDFSKYEIKDTAAKGGGCKKVRL